MEYTLLGLGELLWDIFHSGKQCGGAPANFAFHAQSLGNNGIMVSTVGNDKLGDELLAKIHELNLDRRYISIDQAHPTGTVTVALDDNGKPEYTIHESVAWDYIPILPQTLEIANQADAICFGTLAQRSEVSRESIQCCLKTAKPDALKIFDINLRQTFYTPEIITTSLELANVLKINDEELPVLCEITGFSQKEESLFSQLTEKFDLEAIAVTKGSQGSVIFSRGAVSNHEGYKAELVDTVGAGDSFTAALATGLLGNHELDKINDCANRLATYVCSQSGGTPPLPKELSCLFD